MFIIIVILLIAYFLLYIINEVADLPFGLKLIANIIIIIYLFAFLAQKINLPAIQTL